jgi:hypothetical protein
MVELTARVIAVSILNAGVYIRKVDSGKTRKCEWTGLKTGHYNGD